MTRVKLRNIKLSSASCKKIRTLHYDSEYQKYFLVHPEPNTRKMMWIDYMWQEKVEEENRPVLRSLWTQPPVSSKNILTRVKIDHSNQ